MRSFEKEIAATQQWFDSPRFAGIVRLYTARQVVEQRGTIASDHTLAPYLARCEARPAFQKALADQMASFKEADALSAA